MGANQTVAGLAEQQSGSGHKNGEESSKSAFDQILALANNLHFQSHADEINAVLLKVALAKLDPVETDLILRRISKQTRAHRRPLQQKLEQFQQELGLEANDVPQEVARTVMKKIFHGGTHVLRGPDGGYWTFENTHWSPRSDDAMRNLLLGESNNVKPQFKGNLSSLVSSAKRCLDDLLGTDQDAFGLGEQVASVINCQNGELWISDDGVPELQPHRPESRLTNCLPIKFDPLADCPKFDKALLGIFAESSDPEDMARHWSEFAGYAIQPKRDIASWWLLIGNGSNGKSMLLATLQKLVGPDAVLCDQLSSFQRDRFNIAALAGKILFVDDDLAEGVVLSDGLLKKISEAKQISARHAYGRRKFSFSCHALPVLAGNSYPTTNDISKGMIRRAHIIPFDRVFGKKEADPNLFPSIWGTELPGILNRCLEGLQRLRKRGVFLLPKACVRANHEFLASANPLIAFIDARCEKHADARLYLKDMRYAMKLWAIDQNLARPVADNKLKRKLEGLGYKVSVVKGYPQVFGLRLTSDQ